MADALDAAMSLLAINAGRLSRINPRVRRQLLLKEGLLTDLLVELQRLEAAIDCENETDALYASRN
jgi:hypothetical protein